MIFLYAGMLMSIIYGQRSTNRVLGQKDYTCSHCGQLSAHTIVRWQRKVTLYFIPLIPTGKSTVSSCNLCGFQEQISNEQADSWFSLS